MGDVESEQPQEDFEVEIVDLDELASGADASNSSNKRLPRPSQPLRFLASQARLAARRNHKCGCAGGLDDPGKYGPGARGCREYSIFFRPATDCVLPAVSRSER